MSGIFTLTLQSLDSLTAQAEASRNGGVKWFVEASIDGVWFGCASLPDDPQAVGNCITAMLRRVRRETERQAA